LGADESGHVEFETVVLPEPRARETPWILPCPVDGGMIADGFHEVVHFGQAVAVNSSQFKGDRDDTPGDSSVSLDGVAWRRA
jgi:hypothetical protein